MIITKKQRLTVRMHSALGKIIYGLSLVSIPLILLWLYGSVITLMAEHISGEAIIFQPHNLTDWLVLLSICLLIIVGGSLALYQLNYRVKHSNQRLSSIPFWIGTVGNVMMVASITGLVTSLTVWPNHGRVTTNQIGHILKMVNCNYVIAYSMLGLTLLLIVLLSKPWLKQNNWYVFGAVISILIPARIIYQFQMSWRHFMALKAVTHVGLARMFNAYMHAHATFNTALMNGAPQGLLLTAWLAGGVLVMIGGIDCVQKIKNKVHAHFN